MQAAGHEKGMTSLTNLLGKYKNYSTQPTKQEESEYGYYLNELRKYLASPYIVLHKRLEKVFAGRSMEYVISYLREWYYEAQKHGRPAMIINVRMKEFNTKYNLKKT